MMSCFNWQMIAVSNHQQSEGGNPPTPAVSKGERALRWSYMNHQNEEKQGEKLHNTRQKWTTRRRTTTTTRRVTTAKYNKNKNHQPHNNNHQRQQEQQNSSNSSSNKNNKNEEQQEQQGQQEQEQETRNKNKNKNNKKKKNKNKKQGTRTRTRTTTRRTRTTAAAVSTATTISCSWASLMFPLLRSISVRQQSGSSFHHGSAGARALANKKDATAPPSSLLGSLLSTEVLPFLLAFGSKTWDLRTPKQTYDWCFGNRPVKASWS